MSTWVLLVLSSNISNYYLTEPLLPWSRKEAELPSPSVISYTYTQIPAMCLRPITLRLSGWGPQERISWLLTHPFTHSLLTSTNISSAPGAELGTQNIQMKSARGLDQRPPHRGEMCGQETVCGRRLHGGTWAPGGATRPCGQGSFLRERDA